MPPKHASHAKQLLLQDHQKHLHYFPAPTSGIKLGQRGMMVIDNESGASCRCCVMAGNKANGSTLSAAMASSKAGDMAGFYLGPAPFACNGSIKYSIRSWHER